MSPLVDGSLTALGGVALGVALRDRDRHTMRELWLETLEAQTGAAERELKLHGIHTG